VNWYHGRLITSKSKFDSCTRYNTLTTSGLLESRDTVEGTMRVLGCCPGGEGAVLKTVGANALAGSNPVASVKGLGHGDQLVSKTKGAGSIPATPVSGLRFTLSG
jgi:hypothetical protein